MSKFMDTRECISAVVANNAYVKHISTKKEAVSDTELQAIKYSLGECMELGTYEQKIEAAKKYHIPFFSSPVLTHHWTFTKLKKVCELPKIKSLKILLDVCGCDISATSKGCNLYQVEHSIHYATKTDNYSGDDWREIGFDINQVLIVSLTTPSPFGETTWSKLSDAEFPVIASCIDKSFSGCVLGDVPNKNVKIYSMLQEHNRALETALKEAELPKATENVEQNQKQKHMESAFHTTKPNQAEKIVITKDEKVSEKTIEGSELDKCHHIILGFSPLSSEEEVEDTIDISDFGLKSKQDFSFETISGSGATAISAIKISGRDGYAACVYNFDATNFESASYMAKDFVLT